MILLKLPLTVCVDDILCVLPKCVSRIVDSCVKSIAEILEWTRKVGSDSFLPCLMSSAFLLCCTLLSIRATSQLTIPRNVECRCVNHLGYSGNESAPCSVLHYSSVGGWFSLRLSSEPSQSFRTYLASASQSFHRGPSRICPRLGRPPSLAGEAL